MSKSAKDKVFREEERANNFINADKISHRKEKKIKNALKTKNINYFFENDDYDDVTNIITYRNAK